MNLFVLLQTLSGNFVRWLTVPQSAPEMNRRNFLNVQIDALGVGLSSTAAPFVSVLLLRLGANAWQVSMLTFMPAVTGLILALPLGQFLQTRRSVVPWFSLARAAVLSSYAVTGIIVFFLPGQAAVLGILGIWALVTIPQTILNITFSVVMNSVAGPTGRYELMTHRWSILGFTNAISSLIVGQVLEMMPVPLNYQVVFIALSAGGLISYYFSSKISLPDNPPVVKTKNKTLSERVSNYVHQIWDEKSFTSFVFKRFVFLTGTAMATPLLSIYYVNTLKASDFQIALITIAANTTVIIGYFYWSRETRRHGSQLVLVATTFGGSLYAILVGLSNHTWPVILFAGLNGIFTAGLNLVLFDELMKRVPVDFSATFVAAAQCLQYMSSIVAPLLAPWLSDTIGTGPALIFSGGISLIGFALFLSEAMGQRKKEKATQELTAK